jgi:hypothetical protein
MDIKDLIAELRSNPTVSVVTAGRAFGLGRNAAYEAARRGKLGVPVIEAGGKKRVASAAVLRELGLLNIAAHGSDAA